MRKGRHAQWYGFDLSWSNLGICTARNVVQNSTSAKTLQRTNLRKVKYAFDNHNSRHWGGILHFYWVDLPAGIGKLFSCIQVAKETSSFQHVYFRWQDWLILVRGSCYMRFNWIVSLQNIKRDERDNCSSVVFRLLEKRLSILTCFLRASIS